MFSFFKKNKVLYFAYGSNMLMDRLVRRVGEVTVHKTFTLKDHELVFSVAGFADVMPRKGEVVEGVLYEMSLSQIEKLDYFEALYSREVMGTDNGMPIYVYIGHSIEKLQRNPFCFFKDKPHLEYLNLIIEGAINFHLTTTAKKLIDYKNQNYKLKKRKRYNI